MPACMADGFLFAHVKTLDWQLQGCLEAFQRFAYENAKWSVCSKTAISVTWHPVWGFRDAYNIAERFGLSQPHEFKTLLAKSVQDCGMKAFLLDSKAPNEVIVVPCLSLPV